MEKGLTYYLGAENILPECLKMLRSTNGSPLLIIFQRMKYDLKTVDSYIIGTVFEGRVINERSGKGKPVLLEEERKYSVFEFYNVPYNYSIN